MKLMSGYRLLSEWKGTVHSDRKVNVALIVSISALIEIF